MVGALSVAIAALLLFAEAEQKRVVYFNFDAQSFSATGKWVSPSPDPKDQPAHPQEVQLDCFRQSQECIEATAEYYMGHPHVSLDYLNVVKWDTNGIIATSSSGAV